MKKGVVVLVVVLAAFLVFAIWGFQAVWRLSGPTHISAHGYIAMGIAAVFTVLLGGGLMWLAFYSARRGYDEGVGVEDEDGEDRE
jgi:hypothetical protein